MRLAGRLLAAALAGSVRAAAPRVPEPGPVAELRRLLDDVDGERLLVAPARIPRAREESSRLLKKLPDYAMAHALRGASLIMDCAERNLGFEGRRNCNVGIFELEEAMRLDPKLAWPYYLRASQRQRRDAAWELASSPAIGGDCDKAIALAPWDTNLVRLCAELYAKLGPSGQMEKRERALRLLDGVPWLRPEDALARHFEESLARRRKNAQSRAPAAASTLK